MARITFKRGRCKTEYMTTSGPVSCPFGALRGKDYCSRHRPTHILIVKSLNDAVAEEIMRTDIPGSTIPLSRARFAAGVLARELGKLINKEEQIFAEKN